MSEQPTGYSYIRWSSAPQGEGDSLRRQTSGGAEDFCAPHGLRRDLTQRLHDPGVSACRGADRIDKHDLGKFLEAVKQGKVKPGSYLIVENLDRLTREHIRPALTLLLNLIEAGIRVVQLRPVEQVFDENVEPMNLMMAIMELSRGHSESAVKSYRVSQKWEQRRK